jgi:hypothetical protein
MVGIATTDATAPTIIINQQAVTAITHPNSNTFHSSFNIFSPSSIDSLTHPTQESYLIPHEANQIPCRELPVTFRFLRTIPKLLDSAKQR